jgi:hypothetical protein
MLVTILAHTALFHARTERGPSSNPAVYTRITHHDLIDADLYHGALIIPTDMRA